MDGAFSGINHVLHEKVDVRAMVRRFLANLIRAYQIVEDQVVQVPWVVVGPRWGGRGCLFVGRHCREGATEPNRPRSNTTLCHTIKYKFNEHEVKRNLDLISFNNENWKILPEIIVPLEQEKKVNDFLTLNNTNNTIAIAPGSVWNTKKYPLEYFEKIIDYLTSKFYEIILIGGSKDETICNNLSLRFNGSVISIAGKFSVVESIQMLKNVKLLISNDSAPTHMGVCADIPVLTLFCSTTPAFGFYPYNRKSSYLSFDDLSCKPCGIHGYEECPIGTFRCGNELSPQIVISKIEKMLND